MYRDYYEILELSKSATQTEIKKAYHKKAMQFHPDRNAWFQKEAERQMKLVNEAYEILSDEEKRRYYDLYEYKDDSHSTKEEKSNFEELKSSYTQSKKREKSNQSKKWYVFVIRSILMWFFKKAYDLFLRLPYVIQFCIVIFVLSWIGSLFDTSNKLESASKITPVTSTIENHQPNQAVSNTGTISDIWKAYCNMYKIVALYSIAPDSKYYKRSVENNSDVSSQKVIAPKLIAERSILWQDELLNRIYSSSGSFKHTASLLKESDGYLLGFLKNMQSIKNVNDFKSNMLSSYAISVNILKSIPAEFNKEYQNYPDKNDINASVLFKGDENGMLCNNHAGVSFWDENLESINAETEELWSKKIMQDANFREEPWVNWKIIRPLIRWEHVTVLDKKEIWNMTWYSVEQNDTKWWISSLAFVDDPLKASAANCDPINGYIDDRWYCSCKEGFEWSRKSISCVRKAAIIPKKPSCLEQYWIGATENNSWGCSCERGYVLNNISNTCEPENVYNSCLDSINWFLGKDGKCYCNQWYTWNNPLNMCIKT